MKRFLLIALTAGLLSPIAAKAETYWLVLRAGIFNGSSLEKIEMKDMNHCESEGKRWRNS